MNQPTENPSPAGKVAWTVFGIASIFVVFQLLLQSSPSILRESFQWDFSLTDAGFGGFSASFYYPYILLQVPSGILVARYGPRLVLAVGGILCAVACVILAVAPNFPWAEGSRILMGIGAGPSVVCAMTLAARWFPPARFPLLVAMVEMAGMIGAALGEEILGLAVESIGWREAMAGCAVFAFLWTVVLAVGIRNYPAHASANIRAESPPPVMEVLRMCGRVSLLLPTLAGGLIASAGMAFGMLWAVPYFRATLDMQLSGAAFVASLFFWGALPGMLLFGWLGSRFGRHALFMSLGAAATFLLLAVILFGPKQVEVMAPAMFLLGFFNSAYALAFPMVKQRVSPVLASASLGMANMMVMGLGGWIFQPLVGILSSGSGAPGAAQLSIFLVAQGIAILLLLADKKTRPEPHPEH